jgi:hypothetical protein
MTNNLNVLSRHFDAKIVDQISLGTIPTILSGRHPHLSSAQHQERLAVAAHEASHFLIALLSCTTNFGSHAYVRVPGKTSKHGGKRGVNGSVQIGNLNSHEGDMMVSLAGSLFSGMVEPDNKIVSSCDQKDYANRLAEYANEKGISIEVAEDEFGQMVIDQTAAVIVQYWPTIDWLATALLLNCNANGDIKLWPIIEYFYSNPKRFIVPTRSTYFQLPQKYADYVTARGLTASVPQEL